MTTTGWVEPVVAARGLADAIELARLVMSSNTLSEVARREVLEHAILIRTDTASPHKHQTRYRSRASLSMASTLNHEHVFPVKWLIEKMLTEPERIAELMTDNAIACTVTIDERKRLNRVDPRAEGFIRYVLAGIEVVDMVDGRVVVR